MAALSASTSCLHRDIRSESRGYKRDKDHSAKWIIGARPLSGVRKTYALDATTDDLEQPAKVRPAKDMTINARALIRGCDYNGKSHNAPRIARKADALAEASSSNTMSRSLAELAPQNSPTKQARTPSIESGVLYSFDAKSSPRNGVSLDALVEKAEREWSNRETVKLVKNEYEILDESGEITVVRESKKGKKNSPKQRPQLIVADDEEDDWERI